MSDAIEVRLPDGTLVHSDCPCEMCMTYFENHPEQQADGYAEVRSGGTAPRRVSVPAMEVIATVDRVVVVMDKGIAEAVATQLGNQVNDLGMTPTLYVLYDALCDAGLDLGE
jgi:hypothetical protein